MSTYLSLWFCEVSALHNWGVAVKQSEHNLELNPSLHFASLPTLTSPLSVLAQSLEHLSPLPPTQECQDLQSWCQSAKIGLLSMPLSFCGLDVARILEPSNTLVFFVPLSCVYLQSTSCIAKKLRLLFGGFINLLIKRNNIVMQIILGLIPCGMRNSPLDFLWHFWVCLLCHLLSPLIIKNDTTVGTTLELLHRKKF